MTNAVTTGKVELLLLTEVAECLRVSPTTIYRLTEKRELPFVRIGGQLRFLKNDVLAYLAGQRIASVERK